MGKLREENIKLIYHWQIELFSPSIQKKIAKVEKASWTKLIHPQKIVIKKETQKLFMQ